MQDTMTYVLSNIRHSIPEEILNLAFKPRKFNTTIEQRIISEIVEGPIILDTNLVGGKRRDIYLNPSWEMDMETGANWNVIGNGIQGSYYRVPPEAREGRNISSVIGVSPTVSAGVPGSSIGRNGVPTYGNTIDSSLSQMLNTRTFGNYITSPQVTLEGTNIIRFNPRQILDGCAISVMLEYDSEFINLNQSGIIYLQKLCLCATQRYIANKLRVTIDETEVVAGMEIGVIKEIVNEYNQKGEEYDALLIKLKGAMLADSRTLSRLIAYGI